jgi:hypothetical protein
MIGMEKSEKSVCGCAYMGQQRSIIPFIHPQLFFLMRTIFNHNSMAVLAALAAVVFPTSFTRAEVPRNDAGATAAGHPAAGNRESLHGQPTRGAALLKKLDPFYKQHVEADGLLIVGSEKVSPYALNEAAYLVRAIFAKRPDVLKKLVERDMYACVMAYNEMQTDLPECRKMEPWWDKRARGLGGRPVSCGEENLLGFAGDPYQGENIFIHEFAHGHEGVFGALDEQFKTRLHALYQKAKESGRFRAYGMNNTGEFWAEGVQSWFNCNRGGGLELLDPAGKLVCHINTREQMLEHMPEYAKLLDESFGQNKWVYVPVAKRLEEPHLRGYDPAKAPVFSWPAKVIEAYNRAEAEKAKKKHTIP